MAMRTLILLLLQQVAGQPSVEIRVVEGLSSNINIPCDLDRQFHPVYWKIQGRVYDLYSIPRIFEMISHESITLPTVDRRMNGWTFQCFAIDPANEGLNEGTYTTLTVLYGKPCNIIYLEYSHDIAAHAWL